MAATVSADAPPTAAGSRWGDDAFLDALRRQADPLADATVARLVAEHGTAETGRVFAQMTSDASPLPTDAPAPLAEFFATTGRVPPDVDAARLDRGEAVYTRHAFPAALALLAKSLPSGYSAPCLARVLTVSGDLDHHPYKRLMGVLQMLVNVTTQHGFEPRGAAVVTAQKMRLLHAGVRTVVPRYRPGYEAAHGVPVNHEDMLGTIMGFSYLVIVGLRQLGVPLDDREAEDLYYPWAVFARLCGIHPEGEPDSPACVPETLADAATFYAAYCRRHYRPAAENPDGVRLARENLEMMRDLVPRLLRLLGFGVAPRVYMQVFLGREGMRRVGLAPVAGHALMKRFVDLLPRLWQCGVDDLPEHAGEALARLVFHHMIVKQWDGTVTFLVPDTRAAMRQLA